MLVALAAIVGIATYHFLSGPTKTSPAAASHPAAAGHHSPAAGHGGTRHGATGHPKRKSTSQAGAVDPHHVVIALTAARGACWVDLTTSTGQEIFAGTLPAGTGKTFTEEGPVSLEMGNPGAVTLVVNGKNQSPKSGAPVTLTLGGAASTAPTEG